MGLPPPRPTTAIVSGFDPGIKENFMKSKVMVAVITLTLLVCFGLAGAADKFGVIIYTGASYDASTSKKLSDSMHITANCYRTDDSAAKVIEFYKKQTGLKLIHESKESAMFKKGNIDITIQNPWMNMQTRERMRDTLISIVKN
jgi:hypothetical protein